VTSNLKDLTTYSDLPSSMHDEQIKVIGQLRFFCVMVLDLQINITRVFECYGYNSGEELERFGKGIARIGVRVQEQQEIQRGSSLEEEDGFACVLFDPRYRSACCLL